MRSGAVWSAGYQPTGAEPDEYEVDFNEDRAEIIRRDGDLTTTLEVLVSAEDDAEVRRVSITNRGARARDIEITSYAELALGAAGAPTSPIRPSPSCSSRPNIIADLGAHPRHAATAGARRSRKSGPRI